MYLRNAEPPLEELLNDPIAHLLMARDRLQFEAGMGLCERREAKIKGA